MVHLTRCDSFRHIVSAIREEIDGVSLSLQNFRNEEKMDAYMKGILKGLRFVLAQVVDTVGGEEE